MKKLSNGFGLVGMLVLLAIAVSGSYLVASKYVKTEPMPPRPVVGGSMFSLELLQNSYIDYGYNVRLQNGQYLSPPVDCVKVTGECPGGQRLFLALDNKTFLAGDFDHDGVQEAVIGVRYGYVSGNATITTAASNPRLKEFLALIKLQDGQPKIVDVFYGPKDIFDFVAEIKSLTLGNDGRITLNTTDVVNYGDSTGEHDVNKTYTVSIAGGKLSVVESGLTRNDSVPANWKTYRNEKYGFEIKYPSNFVLDERENSNSDFYLLLVWLKEPGTNEQSRVFTTVSIRQTRPTSTQDFGNLKDLAEELSRRSPSYKLTNLNLNGEKVLRITGFSHQSPQWDDNLISYRGDMIYNISNSISWFPNQQQDNLKPVEERKPIVAKIVESFKFLPLSTSVNTTNWKTYSNTTYGFEFKYPEKLTTKYTSAHQWPPEVKVTNGSFSCAEGKAQLPTEIRKVIIGKTTYCVVEMKEGAAGSRYSSYAYTIVKEGKLVTLNFGTRHASSCGVYDDPELTECLQEKFDPNNLADEIFSTFRFTN